MTTSNFQKELLDKTKAIVFFTFLFTVPLFFIFGFPDARLAQERYFQVSVMALGALFIGNIWLTLFIWLNLILFAVHGATVGVSQIYSVFLGCVLFSCSRSWFTRNSFKKVVPALYLVAFVSIVFMLLQTFNIDPLHTKVDHTG